MLPTNNKHHWINYIVILLLLFIVYYKVCFRNSDPLFPMRQWFTCVMQDWVISLLLVGPSENPNISISDLSGLTLISVMALMFWWAEMDWLIWAIKVSPPSRNTTDQINSQWGLLAKTIGSYTKADLLKEVSVFFVHAIGSRVVFEPHWLSLYGKNNSSKYEEYIWRVY